ncbi:alpha/beta hydrolase [Planktotalea arctica]|uniref:alpha/beta hydrolase n=1 Tax=Planktotalea arctica TaxID=1481893 RepID=UPI00321BC4F2
MLMKIIKFIAVSLVITALVPLGLIASQWPMKLETIQTGETLNFEAALAGDLETAAEPEQIQMRDGWSMPVRKYGLQDAEKPLLILVHGSGWNGLQYNAIAQNLANDAHVLAVDLRGHGATPERRGDVDYIGQMEDDLADLIKAEAAKDQQVVMLGHSSGGGLVVRFAGGANGALIDDAILFAPFLKHDAPSTRADSGGWAHLLLRRVIGLSILNGFGFTGLNHLTAIQFNMPAEITQGRYGHLATTAYSFRLNTGFAPREDYLSDIAALPNFTLVVGSEDEAFYADKFEGVMRAVTDKGRYVIVEGVDHLGIIDADETLSAIRAHLR